MARYFNSSTMQWTDPGFSIGAGVTFSIAYWVNTQDNTLNHSPVSFNDTSGTGRVTIDNNPSANQMRMVLARATSGIQVVSLSVGTTKVAKHWVFTYNSGFAAANGKIYYNGVDITGSGADGSGAAVLADGDYVAGGGTWSGVLQDFAVWDRVLNPGEIRFMAGGRNSALYIRKGLRFCAPMMGNTTYDFATASARVNAGQGTTYPANDFNINYPFNRVKVFDLNSVSSPTTATLGIMTTRTGWWGDL